MTDKSGAPIDHKHFTSAVTQNCEVLKLGIVQHVQKKKKKKVLPKRNENFNPFIVGFSVVLALQGSDRKG